MKVGIFLDDYVPQDGGGFTFQTEIFDTLIKLADESQHDLVIISSQYRKLADKIKETKLALFPYRPAGLIEKVVALLTRNRPNLRYSLRWSSSFERRARKAGIEFIWFLGPRPKEMDLPYMTTVLDLEHRLKPWFPEVSRWGQWEIRERGFGRFLGRAAAIIVGTKVGQSQVESFYHVPGDRIHILPHPTPSFVLQASQGKESAALDRFDLPKGFLLYPAQFWAHKNHLNLLLALQHLKQERGIEIPLVLVGSDFGNLAYIEEQVKELGLEEQVQILGFVDQDELIALYRQALALSYMTFFGPENLPPLEAMALGCPVIASKVIGAEEQLGNAALLVNPTSSKEIAAAIEKLTGDEKLRNRLIARGRKRAAKWTVDDFVRAAFKILDDFAPIRRVWRD